MTVKSCDILSWISLWASETLCNVIYNMIYFEGVQNSIQEIGNWSDRFGPVLIIPLRVVNICIIGIIFGTMGIAEHALQNSQNECRMEEYLKARGSGIDPASE